MGAPASSMIVRQPYAPMRGSRFAFHAASVVSLAQKP
jgi:hypothetical protein